MKVEFFFLILSFLFQIITPLETHYTNPVIEKDAPDPSIIRADNGVYYLYATGEVIYKSKDLVNWDYVGKVFQGVPRPSFVDVNSYWAPCITKQDKLYVLYFALSVWGGEEEAGIGVATSESPEGPFKIVGKDGKLFSGLEVGVRNSIDPYFIQDGGAKYIIWGSFHGIFGIELTSNGLAVKDVDSKFQIAGTYFEAAYIFKRMNYYYLFASIGSCCEGDDSKYQTVVGRSTHLKGPYTSKNGGNMMNNKFDVVLSGNTKFVGPGHNSRIVVDKDERTWMFYHAYIRGKSDIGRTVCLDEVKWTDNEWPYFEGDGPSSSKQNGPSIL